MRRDSHPADNVSWYDAMAFCRWLSARLGYEVRLPTEWEWQQAATGGDPGNEYPWGLEWDGRRANTYESGLSRSTAVGMYPGGASAQVVLDLAGTVWEWCLNTYDQPSDTSLTDARRVGRGGSWHHVQFGARASSRYHADPGVRYNDLGLRVARSSPNGSLEH
jgi:formylglycine-generating enzyme required for sulfatase activity